jgi:DNA repair protein RadA/Sms
MAFKIHDLSKIKEVPVPRLSTQNFFLDKAFGETATKDGDVEYGLPRGFVSIWGGGSGVGKTRKLLSISADMHLMKEQVLFVETEVTTGQFKTWASNFVKKPHNYKVTDTKDPENIVAAMYQVRPSFVVVDSISTLNNCKSSKDLQDTIDMFKLACEELGTHMAIITHLNKEGDFKGSNDILYMVDVACKLKKVIVPKFKKGMYTPAEYAIMKEMANSSFFVQVEKNRYGKTGEWVAFRHLSDGIQYIDSSLNK